MRKRFDCMTERLSFGTLLKRLRKRAGMTQRDLAAALNYSDSLISSLENAQRQPDLHAVISRFIPALGLQNDPAAARLLTECAAAARGDDTPDLLTLYPVAYNGTRGEEPGHPSVLPTVPGELIGRDEEVHRLCNRLLGHHGRLMTLVGPPGIGKTRLALAVAARLQRHYSDGALFVPLAAISDPITMVSTIAAAVGGSEASAKPPQVRLIELLRRKHMLLVLDNCEQIVGAAPLIAEVVAACPRLSILATSRERLHLRDEQRYRVPPLELAAAVELFVLRAAFVDEDFTTTAANRPTLEAICQRLDCLPLALDLCAAQVDLFAPVQILERLCARPLDLLVDGTHDLPPQHRTLRRAIQRSYELLAEHERVLFRRLGVFVGGWSLEALEEVCSSEQAPDGRLLVETLHALIGKSLVRAETMLSGERRFFMLETIREFALEQAHVHGEEDRLRERHYAAYLHFFRTADSHFRGPEAATWFARAEPEQDNMRAALQWTLDTGRYADAAWLVLVASWYWLLYGQEYESARLIQRLLPHRQMLDPDLRLAVMLWFYAFASHLEDFQPIDRYTDEIRQLLEECSHPILHSAAWHWIAETTPDSSQTSVASEQGIALARAAMNATGPGSAFGLLADSKWILAANFVNYAKRLIERGEFAQAEALSCEALTLFQAQGNDDGIADCLSNLGRLALLRGDLKQASSLCHQVVQHFSFTPGGSYPSNALLAIVILYRGEPIEARRLLTESMHTGLERKNVVLLARICTYLAETALWEGKLDEAGHWLAQSLDHYADPRWHTIDQVERLFLAARLVTAQGDYLRAATLFGLADQVSTRINYVPAEPVHSLIDAARATVRDALDGNVFAEVLAAGQRLSLGEAFTTILAPTAIGTYPLETPH